MKNKSSSRDSGNVGTSSQVDGMDPNIFYGHRK